MLQKTLFAPELDLDLKDNIDEIENRDYSSLIKKEEEKEDKEICYIFLLDQSCSMDGERMRLSIKSLLLKTLTLLFYFCNLWMKNAIFNL